MNFHRPRQRVRDDIGSARPMKNFKLILTECIHPAKKLGQWLLLGEKPFTCHTIGVDHKLGSQERSPLFKTELYRVKLLLVSRPPAFRFAELPTEVRDWMISGRVDLAQYSSHRDVGGVGGNKKLSTKIR